VSTMVSTDFSGFFKYLKATNYFFACIMLNYLKHMRYYFVQALHRAESKNRLLEIAFLKEIMMFESETETCAFVAACGFEEMHLLDQNKRAYNPSSENFNTETLAKYWQQEPLAWLAKKRGKLLNRDLMENSIFESFSESTNFEKRNQLLKEQKQKKEAEEQRKL